VVESPDHNRTFFTVPQHLEAYAHDVGSNGIVDMGGYFIVVRHNLIWHFKYTVPFIPSDVD
jgi:hypothetical protein